MTRVAIQGIRGSYSEEAAVAMLGRQVAFVECASFDEAIAAVRDRRADAAVLPVANKITGSVEPAASLVAASGVPVVRRERLAIEHVLIAAGECEIRDLKVVVSHIQALRQCSAFLAANPHLRPVPATDTATAVRSAIEGSAVAAIGSARAAEIHGGQVLARNIADDAGNWTEFVLVGHSNDQRGNEKC
ncbi:MAG: prephenate dehydratase domain-containing protein [Pyrinomonadaceae bacterium]